jgi:formylglycine-generating enzyme required for sulfatase activity
MPVAYVSAFDAHSYTQWLSELSGDSWQLPTEAEWEKAARWDVARGIARIYPCGDEPGYVADNLLDPIGSHPDAASPYAVEDMVGTVEQWTSSLYRPFPASAAEMPAALEEFGLRILRGQAGYYNPYHARAARRFFQFPGVLDRATGSRLVCPAAS